MNRWERASSIVRRALETERIGRPVAVRITAYLWPDHGELERAAVHLLHQACSWLGSEPDRLTAFGRIDSGHLSLLAAMREGQSAVISVGSSGLGPGVFNLAVWGNRGTLAWEDDLPWGVASAGETITLDARGEQLLQALRQSLQAESTVSADGKTTFESKSHAATAASWPARAARTPRALAPPYGVLLVAGDHTHQVGYAEALSADPRCRLVGLTDAADLSPRRRELNRQMAERLGIPLLEDLHAAMRRDDVQVVSICAEPMRRGPIIVAAAEAGKHLYLDKPLAGTLNDAQAIVQAVQAAPIVSHMWSFMRMELAQVLRRELQSGAFGELNSMDLDLCFAKGHPGTVPLGPRRESAEPEEYELPDSKRELTNVGVYPLVMLLWLTGQPVRRVSATTGNYFFGQHRANNMEDFGQMLLELADGMVATISAGRTGWNSHSASGLNRIALSGTQAARLVDAHRPRIEIWAEGPAWQAPERNPEDPMGMWASPQPERFVAAPKRDWLPTPENVPQIDATYFLDCIEHGRPSEMPAELAAHATEVLLAAYRSAATGSAIELR